MVSQIISSNRADFGFKIDFAPETEDPDRIFRAFSGLIKFCNFTDQSLLKSLDIPIENTLLLDNIEQGSIVVWLKNILKLDSGDLDKRTFAHINQYLVKVKLALVEFVGERDRIINNDELLSLKSRMESLAKETKVNPLNIYTPPHERDLLTSIQKLYTASSELTATDRLIFLTQERQLSINKKFELSEQEQEQLLVQKTIESESCLILKVKKPDYLGESKWQFKYDNRTVDVKFNDTEWLQQFRQQKVSIFPGDAIRGTVRTIDKYDFKFELISRQYILEEVLEVIHIPVGNQLSLFDNER